MGTPFFSYFQLVECVFGSLLLIWSPCTQPLSFRLTAFLFDQWSTCAQLRPYNTILMHCYLCRRVTLKINVIPYCTSGRGYAISVSLGQEVGLHAPITLYNVPPFPLHPDGDYMAPWAAPSLLPLILSSSAKCYSYPALTLAGSPGTAVPTTRFMLLWHTATPWYRYTSCTPQALHACHGALHIKQDLRTATSDYTKTLSTPQ